jgi:putative acetyltransferase
MLIRRETPGDVVAVREVTAAAFGPGPDGAPAKEARLVDELRRCDAWIPALSLVAIGPHGDVVGHVLCTWGRVEAVPVLGLGPLSVRPDHQGRGVGKALVHTVLGAADALDEPLVALLGSPGYYTRFGFRAAAEVGIEAPDPNWGEAFQVRTLSGHRPAIRGAFRYPAPFDGL